jgi:hypothetical protein
LKCVDKEFLPENHNGCIPTKLLPLRSKVDFINNQMFEQLTTKEFVFEIKNFETSTLFVSDRLQLGVHYLQLSSKQSNNIPRSSSFSLVFVVSLV